jgi:tRNA (cytidine/uridine-2'-O-)-methyltransferase
LPEAVISENQDHALRIPMLSSQVRSLNLATAASIAVYEALRQICSK